MRIPEIKKVMNVGAFISGGVIVRLVFLLTSAKHPADPLFVADPYAYLLMAEHAYHGRFFVSFRGFPTSYLSVGYPAIIAVMRHLVLGLVSTWVVALLVNVLSFVATALAMTRLVPMLGVRMALTASAQRGAVLSSVGILAVFPDFVFATGLVMTELVAVAVLAWGIVLMGRCIEELRGFRDRLLSAAGGSVLFGLTVFVRPSMLLLIVPALCVLVIRRRWIESLVAVPLFCLPLVPLAVNNVRVGAGPGITSATWMNVCDGLVNRKGEFEWRRECRVTELPGEGVTAATESRNSHWAETISLLYLRRHWIEWVGRMPLRVGRSIWSGGWATEFSVHWAQNYVWTARLRLFLLLSQVISGVIAGLGLLQLGAMGVRKKTVWWPVLVVALGSLAGVLVSFGQSRFGWPLTVLVFVPFASLLAGRLSAPFSGRTPSVG